MDRIKGLCNVKLEENKWRFLGVSIFEGVANKEEVVVNAALLDESALAWRDDVHQFWPQPVSQELTYNFGKTVHQTNWSEIPWV